MLLFDQDSSDVERPMFAFVNRHSYLVIAAVLMIGSGVLLVSHGMTWLRLALLILLTGLVAAPLVLLRVTTTVPSAEAIANQGRPTLLMFYSNF